MVAIDGPAGAGKSSVSRALAERLGYALLDTGAIYRSVALTALRQSIAWDDSTSLAAVAHGLPICFEWHDGVNRVRLGQEDVTAAIRSPEVSQGASRVSAVPEVRAALLQLQRTLGAQGGVVVEGRDIGTVVFPKAAAKFFLTANDVVRAERRVRELAAAGVATDIETTLREQRARDARDEGREVAPLKAAADAVHIDSSALSFEEVVEQMLLIIEERAAENPPHEQA